MLAAASEEYRERRTNTFATCTDSAIYFACWPLLLMTVAAAVVIVVGWCCVLLTIQKDCTNTKEWNTRRGNITQNQLTFHFISFWLLTHQKSDWSIFAFNNLPCIHFWVWVQYIGTMVHNTIFIYLDIHLDCEFVLKTKMRCYFEMKNSLYPWIFFN